jgi:hypothetical protein
MGTTKVRRRPGLFLRFFALAVEVIAMANILAEVQVQFFTFWRGCAPVRRTKSEWRCRDPTS